MDCCQSSLLPHRCLYTLPCKSFRTLLLWSVNSAMRRCWRRRVYILCRILCSFRWSRSKRRGVGKSIGAADFWRPSSTLFFFFPPVWDAKDSERIETIPGVIDHGASNGDSFKKIPSAVTEIWIFENSLSRRKKLFFYSVESCWDAWWCSLWSTRVPLQ